MELVVNIFVLFLVIFAIHFLSFFLAFLNLVILFFFSLHFVLLVDLTLGAFHLDLIDNLHVILLIIIILHVLNLGTSLLHQGLSTVLGREVSCSHVQSVVVLGRDQELTLLVSQMLIRVVTGLSEKSDEVLELFDLVQVVDESF